MHTFLQSLQTLIAHYGLPAIFVSMAIENAGVPLPTEAAFLVAQQLLARGMHSFWFLFVFIVLAQVAGAVIAYWFGKFIGRTVENKFSRNKKYARAHAIIIGWYNTYGSLTIFATRLIGYVRPWSSFVAGVAEFPFWPFLGWTILGTIILVYITMHLTSLLVFVWQSYPALQPLISIVLLVLFCGALVYSGGRAARRKMRTKRRMD